jgi:ATP-dependent protease Clp ATPase subunit
MAVVFRLAVSQVLAVAVHNHYKRLQNKRMHRAQEAQLQQQAAMVSCS